MMKGHIVKAESDRAAMSVRLGLDTHSACTPTVDLHHDLVGTAFHLPAGTNHECEHREVHRRRHGRGSQGGQVRGKRGVGVSRTTILITKHAPRCHATAVGRCECGAFILFCRLDDDRKERGVEQVVLLEP